MWPFQKQLLKWREPKDFVLASLAIAEKKTQPWWVRPVMLAAIVGMFLLAWYFARLIPSKNPISFPAAIGIILPASILLVYVAPMIIPLLPPPPSEVFIGTNGIVRVRGDTLAEIKLKTISSYYWLSQGDFVILAVMTNRKQPTVFGVPDAETKQKIEHALESLGIPQSSAEPEDRTDAAGDSGGRKE